LNGKKKYAVNRTHHLHCYTNYMLFDKKIVYQESKKWGGQVTKLHNYVD